MKKKEIVKKRKYKDKSFFLLRENWWLLPIQALLYFIIISYKAIKNYLSKRRDKKQNKNRKKE